MDLLAVQVEVLQDQEQDLVLARGREQELVAEPVEAEVLGRAVAQEAQGAVEPGQ